MNQPQPLYNLDYLNEISSGDQQFVLSIVSQFVNDTPAVLHKIRDAYKECKWEDLHYLVHKFAPTLSFVGIDDIHEEVNQLEKNAKNRTELQDAGRLVDIIKRRCELAIEVLKQDFNL